MVLEEHIHRVVIPALSRIQSHLIQYEKQLVGELAKIAVFVKPAQERELGEVMIADVFDLVKAEVNFGSGIRKGTRS